MKMLLMILFFQLFLGLIFVMFLDEIDYRITKKTIKKIKEKNEEKEVKQENKIYKPSICKEEILVPPIYYIIPVGYFGNSTYFFDECYLISYYDIDYIFLVEYPNKSLKEMATGLDIKFPTKYKIELDFDRLSYPSSESDKKIKKDYELWVFNQFKGSDYNYIHTKLENFINSQNAEMQNETQ